MSNLWSPKGKGSDDAHKFSDADDSKDSQHHTLGKQPTQAAAGDHDHKGVHYTKAESDALYLPASYGTALPIIYGPSTNPSGGGAFANVDIATGRFIVTRGWCFVSIRVRLVNVGTGLGTMVISLPVSADTFATQMMHGRENAVNGSALQGIITGSNITVLTYNNSNAMANGWDYLFTGGYKVA